MEIKTEVIILVVAIAVLLVAAMLIRSFYWKGFNDSRMRRLNPTKEFDPVVECERFRKLVAKLHELQIIVSQEHYLVDNDTVYLNIRDLFPIYQKHYPMYFPTDVVPDYEILNEIIAKDSGYSGALNYWFEKSAYRPAIALKRFSKEFNATA